MPKISELASGAPAVSTDALIIQRGGFNYSVTMENVAAFVTTDFASRDITVSGFWKYENQFVVNFQGDEWWWWNGTYVEATDPAYNIIWSMAEDSGGSTAQAALAVASFSSVASAAPYLEFDRARGLSGNPDFVNAGDELGTILWQTYTSDDGVAPFNGIYRDTQATISVVVDEDRTTTGTDYESVSMYFEVAGGVAPSTALTLKADSAAVNSGDLWILHPGTTAPDYGTGIELYNPSQDYSAMWVTAENAAGFAPCGITAQNYTGSNAGPSFQLIKARGSQASPLANNASDVIGVWSWSGYNTAAGYNTEYAAISVSHAAVGSASPHYSNGANLYFQVGSGSRSDLENRLAILSDGGIVTYNATDTVATGGSKGAGTINCKGLYVDGVPANLAPTVVASLPAAATAGAGARGFATDATATTFHSIVAGGGANFVPVFSDGTNWRIG